MKTTRILVVEDESVVAMDIQTRLISLGYDVPAVASYGEEAVRKASALHPDLVLMDIKLKGEMDGVKAAETIRSKFDIPVVFLTAYADGATLQRAKITEAFGYLLKPFKERELHTTIEMALYKHKAERRLKESKAWLSTTLRSIGDAVIATDAQCCVQLMNPLAETLTGWTQTQAIGQNANYVFRIVDAHTRAPRTSPVTRALQEGRTVQLEDNTLLLSRRGTETPIDDSAAPIRDEDGKIIGAVLVFRDVSKRVQDQVALEKHAAELKIRNEELDAFAHTVAHDLKNPLNLMVGFAQVLQEEYTRLPSEELERYLRIMAQNGQKMGNIIDELLLLAGVREMEVQFEPLDMASIVNEAQARLAHMIEEHQAQIITPPNFRWPVALGYAPWVEEVWVNYLSNGIKYGGQPPRLRLGARVLPNGKARFWIQDNGPGLTAKDQAQLFTPFTQLDKIRANGHGLGLSIVRRIVKRLDGEVGVVSKVGTGSIFTFTLPLADAPGSDKNEG
jgi:PAS domain S-box-containing protein